MKKLIYFLPLLLVFAYFSFTGWSVENQNDKDGPITNYYYYKGQPFTLKLKSDMVFVKLRASNLSESSLNAIVSGVIPTARVSKFQPNDAKQFISIPSNTDAASVQNLVKTLNARPEVEASSPVFSPDEGTTLIGVENEIIVQFRSYVSESDINSFISARGLSKINKLDLQGGTSYVIRVPNSDNGTAIDAANEVYRTGLVNWSEPNLYFTNLACYMPNDQFIGSQWSVRNTGNNIPDGITGTVGADMRIDSAWNTTLGHNKVVVVVSDTGIDTLHEDLTTNLIPGTGMNFYNNPPTPGGQDDGNHGTACAGIIAAQGNNTIGTSGISPNSRLIAAKWLNSGGSGNYVGAVGTIVYGYQKGGWIISNSWGFVGGASTALDQALTDAVTLGRGGKGTILCFASGNENGAMRYPASSHPSLLVVGGLSPCNQRKSPTSCDNETWWGASYGPTLDIVAPCTKIYASDRMGTPGYSTTNYFATFNGTSSATPNTAGVTALMLSVDSTLRWDTLRAYVGRTAKRVGSYSYTVAAGHNNGTWNNEMGYGSIDGNQAVKYVLLKKANFPLSAYNLQTPSAGSRLVSFPGSSTPVSFNWDTSATGANYKLIFGNPTTSTRRITIPSGTNLLSMTLGEWDNILASAGFTNNGSATDSAVGQWDVWAFKVPTAPGPDSLKATNGPRSITLRRGIPALSPFSLVTPPTGTTITTSVFNSGNININWTRSGSGTKYKWLFDAPTFSGAPIFYIQSGNTGFDSSITLVNNQLDAMLAGSGLAPGDSLVGQWRVYAYRSASDSLASTQTFALTLKRQAKGDVLVAYDSTAANCLISRDSVTTNLVKLGVTFDLYNRGTASTTTSLSFRGYKKVIVLGEGTSTLAPVQKDSLKAYLSSGGTTATTKSKLIIFSEDVGYNFDRAAAPLLDTTFARQYLGFIWVADRPATGAGLVGLKGISVLQGQRDSTVGPWPDVFRRANTNSTKILTGFRLQSDFDSVNSIGRMATNYNTATIGLDVESMRYGNGGPTTSPVARYVKMALDYVDQLLVSTGNEGTMIPDVFSLSQNYPNPFNPTTKINFAVPKSAFVTMKIFDVTGREVARLVNNTMAPGYHSVDFNAATFASGVYFYRIEAGEFVDTKRMMLIK